MITIADPKATLVCEHCGNRTTTPHFHEGKVFCGTGCSREWEGSRKESQASIDEIFRQIHQPTHYAGDGMECIDAIRARLGAEGFRAYCIGCSMKYLWRAGAKGDAKTDLAKAAKYMEFAQTK